MALMFAIIFIAAMFIVYILGMVALMWNLSKRIDRLDRRYVYQFTGKRLEDERNTVNARRRREGRKPI